MKKVTKEKCNRCNKIKETLVKSTVLGQARKTPTLVETTQWLCITCFVETLGYKVIGKIE